MTSEHAATFGRGAIRPTLTGDGVFTAALCMTLPARRPMSSIAGLSYDPRANARSWRDMRGFLDEIFAQAE